MQDLEWGIIERRRTYIGGNAPNPLLDHTPLEERIGRLGHLRQTRVPVHRAAQQQRLHEAKSVAAQDPPR